MSETHPSKRGPVKAHRSYLLTLRYPQATADKASPVLLQASQSNEVHQFPDLASAFAFLEAQADQSTPEDGTG